MRKFFTSESVTEGHPDKMADQISDAILDAIMEKDPDARVACETFLTTGMALIAGEISTKCYVHMPTIVRDTIEEIGYNDSKFGFDFKTCAVLTSIDEQSSDIAQGVDNSADDNSVGAGDQGMMFGYATNETDTYMPLPIALAHGLTKRLAQVRKSGELSYLLPDGKAQVTVEYDEDQPIRIDAVVVSTQHKEEVRQDVIRQDIIEKVIKAVLPAEMLDENTKYFINPTGKFVIGGPMGDTGLTGRKIIVDTYGGMARHGGGAFSGKDCTKVDRSAAYAARWVAKNVVAAGFADKCEVQLAYAIGVAKPMSIRIDTFGSNKIAEEKIIQAVEQVFDLRPAAIIRELDLRKPIYKQTAAYGHFGRNDLDLSWERLNKVEELQKAVQ